jgi:non-ribosomal peptide synthetase-like protein
MPGALFMNDANQLVAPTQPFPRIPAALVHPGLKEPTCLHELFAAQAHHRPHAPALICDDETLTYGELEARANQLARYLRMRGAKPKTFVAIFFERSMSPIVAILACLKAGAAYVPIDPSYPVDRIRHIFDESQPVLLLTDNALAPRALALAADLMLNIEEDAPDIALQSAAPLPPAESGVLPEDLCYVIYTSGTTGRPKGVMTEHRHALRFVLAFNEVCGTLPADRVYQGFSLGFDGSVEEMWMAFSNGSALVVGTAHTPRFGDDLAQYLSQRGVTYFSTVPTLLSTMTRGISTLRLLVVSGEICSPELVNRWARPGLRMLNVYGPTEATVNTTYAECIAGQPVTIGRPLPGYHLYILDEAQRPVARGEKGELFVAGETLARGYFEQPALTAERFVRLPHLVVPGDGRLYRTGDLVRETERGELEFFGRIDTQVKIRGYRVELAEIESILLEDPSIQSASVSLVSRDGLQELAAYVVRRDADQPIDRSAILGQLETRLPPYMIPAHLDELPALPMLASGKVDRRRLPPPTCALVRAAPKVVPPASEQEARVAAVWARTFGLPEVSVLADFFHDLGGHSLLAAQMVTQLRHETHLHVTIRDAYKFSTVRELAAHLATLAERAPVDAGPHPQPVPPSQAVLAIQPRWVRATTAALQAASTYLLYGLSALPLGILFLLGRGFLLGEVSTGRLIVGSALVILLTLPARILISIVGKWLLIGRYRAGSHPLWGFYYLRFWLANRLHTSSGVGVLAGTPLLPLYFRLMGARVGRHTTLDTTNGAIWDLLRIGEETSIGADTQLLGYRVENGMLVLGHVDIGSRCFVGLHSALGLDVRMEDGARLDDQSLLPDRQVIPAGEGRRGSPALPAEVALPAAPATAPVRPRPILFGAAHLVLLQLLSLTSMLSLLPLLALLLSLSLLAQGRGVGLAVAWLAVSVPVGVGITCLYLAALKRLVLSRVQPGVYSIYSGLYLRKWLSDGIMRSARALLLPLYTTLYLPPWLRLLGARIGARAELSTIWYFAPELCRIAEESFFADGSIIGGKRIFGGRVELGENYIGRRSFVGNSAILPVGTGLGERCLLGVQSLPPVHGAAEGRITADGTEWLGSPAFALPRRPKVGNFDDTVTFRPTARLYAQRAVIDALRIVIPGYIGLSVGCASLLLLNAALTRYGVAGMFAAAPLISLAGSLVSTLLVVALKWLVMGAMKPVIKPLWSMYVWLNEMVNGAYESVMAPAIAPLLGTPFIAPILRLLGCRIGRHAYIETTLFSEFDLVEIGDFAALNAGAVIQNHLFEDRVMKSSHLKIGAGCSVGNMAVVLYDSEMHDGAVLGPLSLLMKGEKLAAQQRFHGIPCMRETEASRPSPAQAAARSSAPTQRPRPAPVQPMAQSPAA